MSRPPQQGPRPFTGWQWIWRGCFGTEFEGHRYDIEVDYFDFSERIWLYVDGTLHNHKKTKGVWNLSDGARLEVALQLYGMRRARIRTGDGRIIALLPAPGSWEHWRADMHERHPTASRITSGISLAVIVVALVLAIPQWISMALSLAGIQWSWIGLSPGLTSVLTVLAIAAGIERALRLRRESFS